VGKVKIALINGQDHKGSTYHIGRMLAEKMTDTDNITEVFLPRDMPKFCCGCAKCITENEKLCPHRSYLEPITETMDSADVLIFTTPVYVFHATGSMKAFLDHYAYRWMVHRPEEKMFSKQAVCISTAAGAGMKSACRDIKDSLFFWGVAKIYRYGVAVAAVSWDEVSEKKKIKIEKKLNKLSKAILKRDGNVNTPLKTKLVFYIMRIVYRHPWNPADGDYWQAKGWIGSARPWKSL
jgi:multimeric flavodoxin WrbA